MKDAKAVSESNANADANTAKDGDGNALPMQSNLLGKVEKTVGGMVGCEGLEEDGKGRIQERKIGIEEGSGTG